MRGARLLVLCLVLLMVPPPPAQAAADPVFTKVWTGLAQPVDMEFAPDGSLYYIELMQGGLRRIAPNATAPDPEPLWKAEHLQTGGERGLMGMALDPDFETTRAVFLFYTRNDSGTPYDRLVRVVDGQETVLLDSIRTEVMHNSGRLLFMPDKTLLVSVGDATLDTIGRQASMHAHDASDIHGKVLRIDRDGNAVTGNPWGTLAWTKGHRNVYGLARDPTGTTIIGTENGPDRGDEVNVLVGGKDYGWPDCAGPCAEDPNCANAPTCDASRFVDPVLSYTPTVAPTGATWHAGHFYFTDFNQGRLHRARAEANGSWSDITVARLGTRALDVTTGPDGLYVSSWDSVYRIRFADAENGVAPPPTPTTTAPTLVTTTSAPPTTATSPTQGGAPNASPQESAGAGSSNAAIGAPGVALALAAVAVGALLVGRGRAR